MTDILAEMAQYNNEYLRNAVMTASPEQLHLMLYDGAIRFARQGVEGIKAKNYEMVYNGFNRAEKIVLEMLNSLNYDIDRALCERMAGLYTFIYRKLVEASTQRNVEIAEEAIGLLEYQRETWVMLIDKLNQERASQEGPQPAAAPPEPTGEPVYSTLSVEG
jgi:flagellar protein FliS